MAHRDERSTYRQKSNASEKQPWSFRIWKQQRTNLNLAIGIQWAEQESFNMLMPNACTAFSNYYHLLSMQPAFHSNTAHTRSHAMPNTANCNEPNWFRKVVKTSTLLLEKNFQVNPSQRDKLTIPTHVINVQVPWSLQSSQCNIDFIPL